MRLIESLFFYKGTLIEFRVSCLMIMHKVLKVGTEQDSVVSEGSITHKCTISYKLLCDMFFQKK